MRKPWLYGLDDDFSDEDEDMLADVPDHPMMARTQSRSAATAKAKPHTPLQWQ